MQLKSIRDQVALVGARIQPKLLPHESLAHRNAFAHIWLGVKTIFGEHWRESGVESQVTAFVTWIDANPNADYESFPGPVTHCKVAPSKPAEKGLFD